MTIRAGMQELVDRLREFASVTDAEYTDDDLQDILDRYKKVKENIYLVVTPFYTANNVLIYRNINLPEDLGAWFELPQDDVINEAFYLMDYLHAPVLFGTGDEKAVYNADLRRIVLNTVPTRKTYYLNVYCYDVYGAAAFLWSVKLAARVSYIDVKMDNHTLALDQEYQHCKDQYNKYYALSEIAKEVKMIRRDQGVGVYSATPSNGYS